MDFIVKLLFLGGKYISQAAGRTILEIIHRGREFRNNISVQYEKASEIVKPYDNMLELLNERVREASEDDIHFAYMNDELKKQLEEHMRKLSSINPERTNVLVKNNWQNEDKPFKEEGKYTLLSTETNYDDLEGTYTGKDVEYDKMYTDLCKDLLKQSSEVLNDATHINRINIPKTTHNIGFKSIDTKEENSISEALGNLENKINSSNLEILNFDSKKSEEEGEESFTFQNIKQYTHINTRRNPLSTLYYRDAINMNYLVEQSPTDSYYNTNVINKNMKRSAKNIYDNKEQTPANCTKPQKKFIKACGDKLLNTDDIMQVNNKAIIHGLTQEIENRMVLLNKNREYFKIFEKKLHDRMIRNKVKQISKDVEHRASILKHNIMHYNKFESKLEKKLKNRINKIVCRKLSSGLSVDSNNGMKHNIKEVIKLLKVNEKEFQKLEEKVTQLLIRQGLDMCFFKINYREIEKPICKNCLSNSDKEEMNERERIIEVNRKAFENFERDMSRIVILDKNKDTNKGDSTNKESNAYGIHINKLRKNISRSYTNRYDMLSNVLKNQQNISESSYKKNMQKHFSKCSLSSRDRDDIRERASILEINAKAFEMYESKANNIVSPKNKSNLMISRTLSSTQKNDIYENDNSMKEDKVSRAKHSVTASNETKNATNATKALKKLIDKSMISTLSNEHEIKELIHLNSINEECQSYKTGDNIKNEDMHLVKQLAKEKINKMGKLNQNCFEKVSDFKSELESEVKNENMEGSTNTNHLNNSVPQYIEKCLEKSISVEGDTLANLQNEIALIKCNEKEKNILLNDYESNNLGIEKTNENTYPNNFESKDFNYKNIFSIGNIASSTTSAKKLEIDQTDVNSKIPRLNNKIHPTTGTAEIKSKPTRGSSTNFQQRTKIGESISNLTNKELMTKPVKQSKITDTKFPRKQYVKNQHFPKKNSKTKDIVHTQSVSSFRIVDDQETSKFDLKNKNVINKPYTSKGKCSQSSVKSQSTSCLEGYNTLNKTNLLKNYDEKHFKSKKCSIRKNESTIKRPEAQMSEKSVKAKMLNTNNQIQIPCSRQSKIPSLSIRKITKFQENKNTSNENITSCKKNENNEIQIVKDNIQSEIQIMNDIDGKNKNTIETYPKNFPNLEISVTKSEMPNLNNKMCLHDGLNIAEQEKNINIINKILKQYENEKIECSNTVFVASKSKFDDEELHCKTLKDNKSTVTSKIPQLQQTYGSEIVETNKNLIKLNSLKVADVKKPQKEKQTTFSLIGSHVMTGLPQFKNMSIDDTKSKVPSSMKTRSTEEEREIDNSKPLANEFAIPDKNTIGMKNNKSVSETSISKFLNTNEQTAMPDIKTPSASEIIINANTPDRTVDLNKNSGENRCNNKSRNVCQQKKYSNERIDEFNITNCPKTTDNSNTHTLFNKLMEIKKNISRNENKREHVNLSTMSRIPRENLTDRRNTQNEKEKLELSHTKLVQVTGSNRFNTREETFDTHLKDTETHSVMNKSHRLIEPTEKVKGDVGAITSELRKLDDRPLRRTSQNKVDNINTFENQKLRPQFRNIHNNHNSPNIPSFKITTNVKIDPNETKIMASDTNSKPRESKQNTCSKKNSHNLNIAQTDKKTENQFSTKILPSNKVSQQKIEAVKEISPNKEKSLNKDIIINKKKYCLKKILAYVPVDGQTENPSIYDQNSAKEVLPILEISNHFKQQRLNEIQKTNKEKNWTNKKTSTNNSSKSFESITCTKGKKSNILQSDAHFIEQKSMDKLTKANAKKTFSLKRLSQLSGDFIEKKSTIDSKQNVNKYIEPSETEVVLNQIKDDVDLDMYYKNFIINYNRAHRLQEISTRELHRHDPYINTKVEQTIPNFNDQKELSYEIALSKKNTLFAKRLLRENIPRSFRSMSTQKNTDLFKKASANKESVLCKEEKCSTFNNTKANALNQHKIYSVKKQKDEVKSEILNKNLKSNKTYKSTNFAFREAKFAFLPLDKTSYKDDYNLNLMHSNPNKIQNIVQDSDDLTDSTHIPQSRSPLLSYFLSKNSQTMNIRKM